MKLENNTVIVAVLCVLLNVLPFFAYRRGYLAGQKEFPQRIWKITNNNGDPVTNVVVQWGWKQ